ncbi:hypothetical protein D3C72_2360060 [compost metagenome]
MSTLVTWEVSNAASSAPYSPEACPALASAARMRSASNGTRWPLRKTTSRGKVARVDAMGSTNLWNGLKTLPMVSTIPIKHYR